MPRKKTDPQPPAETTTDPMALFNLAARDYRKDPDTWHRNGLDECINTLLADENAAIDPFTGFDQAVAAFRKLRTRSAAELVFDAADMLQQSFIKSHMEAFVSKYNLSVPENVQLPLPMEEGLTDDDQTTE